MRVFITGASGFIGSAVATTFAAAGHDVLGLVRTPEKARALEAHEIECVIGSMEDPRSYLERVGACEVLIHCAADYSERNAQLDKRTIDALIGAASAAKAPRLFLYTSGVWVYGDTGAERVSESSPTRPPAIAAQRVVHERSVLEHDSGPLRTMVIRPGCVYGGSGSLTAIWFQSAQREKTARIIGDGANRWAMVHVEDLARFYLRAAESPLRGEIFNVVDRSRFCVLDCARAASHAAGAGGKVESLSAAQALESFGPMAECLAFTQHVDASKAVRLLGWQPRHGGFADGAERYFRAWRAARRD